MPEERLLDVVRGQGVAGEQDVEIALADQLADVLDAAGVDDGGAEDGEDLLARILGAFHGGGDLAHRHALGLFAGNGAGHELEQVLPRRGLRGKHAQPGATRDDAVAGAHVGHGNAARRRALGINEDAAVHLLIFHVDPFAAQAHLRAVIRGAVKVFGERAVHVGGHDLAVADGQRGGPVIVDGVEDFTQLVAAVGAHFDAGVAGIALPLADADVLDDVGAAVREDLVEHLGQ